MINLSQKWDLCVDVDINPNLLRRRVGDFSAVFAPIRVGVGVIRMREIYFSGVLYQFLLKKLEGNCWKCTRSVSADAESGTISLEGE